MVFFTVLTSSYKFLQDNTLVTLKNCQVFLNRQQKFQVVIQKNTSIEKSLCDTTYYIEEPKTLGSPMTYLSDIGDYCEYDRVTVQIKVIKLNDSQLVSTGKTKQEIDIADSTLSTSLTLWVTDVGCLSQSTSYQINRVQIQKHNGRTKLTFPTHGASYEQIPDLEIQRHLKT